jgi:hypothetical protein
MRKFLLTVTLASVAGLLVPATSFADACSSMSGNLLTNCSFQTGLAGWTLGGNSLGNIFVESLFDGYSPYDGSINFLAAGPLGSDGTISQTFSDVAGETYTIGAYVASNGSIPNDFDIGWDGTTVFETTDIPSQPYTLYTATVTGTGSDTVSFSFRDDPSFIAIDDLSVVGTPISPVPEPGYLTLLPAGLAAIVFARKRRSVKA